MPETQKMTPIFLSRGETGAILVSPHIFNLSGDWIGWVDDDQMVYSVHGHFAGQLTKDPRILRKREWSYGRERKKPPTPPNKIKPPAHFPLAPTLPEVPMYMVDVLEECPDTLPSIDFGDLRDDME